jgi:hypothetical protein
MIQIDASKSAGVLLGTDVGQLIVAALQYFWHIPVSDVVAGSITGICIFVFSHLIPNTSGPTAPKA